MIRIVRDDIGDQFSFLLEVFILKNEGVITVLRKITFMTSLDQKCVREARKWCHAVRIRLAIIFIFTLNLQLKNVLGKHVFRKTHACDHL